MILVAGAWFLLLADLFMTYAAIKRYGYGIESNHLMRALIKADDRVVTQITIVYCLAILLCHVYDLIGLWEWIAIYSFPLMAFVSNTIWFIKFWKR